MGKETCALSSSVVGLVAASADSRAEIHCQTGIAVVEQLDRGRAWRKVAASWVADCWARVSEMVAWGWIEHYPAAMPTAVPSAAQVETGSGG